MSHAITVDGNEAVARVAFKLNEVIAIYPITPSSPMGEWADLWSARGEKNLWGATPLVHEMQAEGGAAGAVHGALQTGALTTTFTASQGLLLMIPNMFKIAGELTSAVFHIAARSVAAQALSIFGDHSDVMAARGTGWAMLFAASVQEAHDFALITQASTLATRVPFLHVMDGFRTSHEVAKIEALEDGDLRALIDDELVRAHRARALTPDRPVVRGTAQNPDVFFQAREAVNPYYLEVPGAVQRAMDLLAERSGRRYRLFDYVGDPEAERVIVLMGSGAGAAEETVAQLNAAGEKVGLIKVRLFRPFSSADLLAALPASVRVVAVLDRTKEPGSAGEPLYQDVVTAVSEGVMRGDAPFVTLPRVIGGRYGLASKEFSPAMVMALFAEMEREAPRHPFTLGIRDDLTHTSLEIDPSIDIEPDEVVRAIFWGLGSDGTVGANKNTIKIIGEATDFHVQGYFVYDSKKSGAQTVSHLRFSPEPIRSSYLIRSAQFVAVHQFGLLDRYPVLDGAAPGGTLLLNSPFPPDQVWDQLPRPLRQGIVDKGLELYTINAYRLARGLGLGNRINTIMQTCFFAISEVLPREDALSHIRTAIRHSYGRRGEAVLRMNFAAVDAALENLHRIEVPIGAAGGHELPPTVPPEAPAFVQEITAEMIAGRGDALPVSALPADGSYPSGTTRWEKRNIAREVPVWDPEVCIQCGKCVLVCPHAVIRAKLAGAEELTDVPEGFLHAPARWKGLEEQRYTLQVSAEDCTGCTLCVEVCPAKDKRRVDRKALNMAPQRPLSQQMQRNWQAFLGLPDNIPDGHLPMTNVKNVQLLTPLFEFSGACAGCGETPYLKLLSQLFGDRALIANATGCSSIYGGNLPTTPWAVNAAGRGPAWSNSLFEDNAEFGLGMRLTLDSQQARALQLLDELRPAIGDELVTALESADQNGDAEIEAQRRRVAELRRRLEGTESPQALDLLSLAGALVDKSVWLVGGDGWAYDIGYGGLDHVLASGRNVNVLVLDTEVYSNTGGQASKATALGAVAKFAAAGKATPKKDLGRMVMQIGSVYVAQVAMGANDTHTVHAFLEAEAYPGPSLIIAYSHCIAHGIDMAKGLEQQKLATHSGYWPLFRFDPARRERGENPFQLDSRPPKIPFKDYALNETRYRMLYQTNPENAERLLEAAQVAVTERWQGYQELARKGV